VMNAAIKNVLLNTQSTYKFPQDMNLNTIYNKDHKPTGVCLIISLIFLFFTYPEYFSTSTAYKKTILNSQQSGLERLKYMASELLELDDKSFQEAIGTGVTLVDFWAPWCGPCMMQGPIVEKVAGKIAGKATVAKINVDDSMQTAMQYKIQSIPTLMVFKNGEVAHQLIGLQTEEQLLSVLEESL
jgi:thioredoxin